MQVTNLFYQHPHALIIILFDIIIVIIRSSSDVCKLRLDFETMVLAAPFSVRLIMIKRFLMMMMLNMIIMIVRIKL